MLSIIIPTHGRPEELALTLAALSRLDPAPIDALLGGAEVIIADNASPHPVTPPRTLRNGLPVRTIYRPTNEAAAGRNAAARAAAGPEHDPDHWLLMLDDDSAPIDEGFAEALAEAPPDAAAVGAEVFLPAPLIADAPPDEPPPPVPHEHGGLPEVFIGCGVAIRRRDFLAAGGYDPSFGFYAEEYDLAARFLLAGKRTIWDQRFRVLHRKSPAGRDINTILRNIVRNTVCVAQRYAPEERCGREIEAVIDRCRAVAEKEGAIEGFNRGIDDLHDVITRQPRREMSDDLYDRFTGLTHAQEHLAGALARAGARTVALADPPAGPVPKHRHIVQEAVLRAGARICSPDPHDADAQAVVVATLSPGPMLDARRTLSALVRVPVITPWRFDPAPAAVAGAA